MTRWLLFLAQPEWRVAGMFTTPADAFDAQNQQRRKPSPLPTKIIKFNASSDVWDDEMARIRRLLS